MGINGSAVLHAPRERVWDAVTDPQVLASVIPGCESLEPLDENRFALTVRLGVASIKGSYSGEVAFSDMRQPESFTIRARGSGAPRTVDTTVAVTLNDHADGTRLDYEADAVIGGMVGGVGQRVLAGAAKRTVSLFFSAIDARITGAPAPAAAVPTAASKARVAFPVASPAAVAAGERPVAALLPATGQRVGAVLVAVAAAVGAAAALAGILIGVRIGRRG